MKKQIKPIINSVGMLTGVASIIAGIRIFFFYAVDGIVPTAVDGSNINYINASEFCSTNIFLMFNMIQFALGWLFIIAGTVILVCFLPKLLACMSERQTKAAAPENVPTVTTESAPEEKLTNPDETSDNVEGD